MAQTAILGAGVMGETLLSGLVRAGRRVDNLLVGEKRPERAAELEERYGVAVVSNVEAAAKADTVAIVVKPQDMADLLDEIAPSLRAGQLIVSLAAGITTAFIESRVPAGVAVVRVMPNTPALVDEGMAAISPGSHCDEEHLAEAEALMGSVGRVVRIPERQQDAVTAISGSGPAYIFFVVESMIEAGVHLGLPRTTATELVIQTLVGSAKMLRETGTHPTVLREQVTSPGGTTASALRELEIHKVRAAFLAAMEAARDRSRELAEGTDVDEAERFRSGSRRSTMRSFLGLLVVPLALGACGDDGETASGGWARLPDLPFATSLPITAWTGEEVLVVGGDTRPCPPNAGCANPSRIITTGAAYDVDDERWRPIADAPQPLAGYDRSTFVDGTLVVQTDEGRTWLAYDVAEDAWRRLPAPPEPTLDAGSLTADGSGFVALTESRGVVRHDLGRAWVPYPDPPLRPVTAVAIGNGIAVSSADGAITVWDGQEWSPPQPVPQANPFRHWTGEALVEIDPQEYDDVPAGGRYEPDSGEWTASGGPRSRRRPRLVGQRRIRCAGSGLGPPLRRPRRVVHCAARPGPGRLPRQHRLGDHRRRRRRGGRCRRPGRLRPGRRGLGLDSVSPGWLTSPPPLERRRAPVQ